MPFIIIMHNSCMFKLPTFIPQNQQIFLNHLFSSNPNFYLEIRILTAGDVRETLARVFYLTSEKMLAKDNQSSFQEYLQATFWLTPPKLTHTCVTLHNQLLPSSGLAWTGKGYK